MTNYEHILKLRELAKSELLHLDDLISMAAAIANRVDAAAVRFESLNDQIALRSADNVLPDIRLTKMEIV